MILIDTHIWLRWLVAGTQRLQASLIDLLETTDTIAVSAVSCWEVAMLSKRGHISLPVSTSMWLDHALDGSGVDCLDVTRRIASRAAALSEIHRDPADRFIIATAVESNCRLVTLDETIKRYPEVAGLLLP